MSTRRSGPVMATKKKPYAAPALEALPLNPNVIPHDIDHVTAASMLQGLTRRSIERLIHEGQIVTVALEATIPPVEWESDVLHRRANEKFGEHADQRFAAWTDGNPNNWVPWNIPINHAQRLGVIDTDLEKGITSEEKLRLVASAKEKIRLVLAGAKPLTDEIANPRHFVTESGNIIVTSHSGQGDRTLAVYWSAYETARAGVHANTTVSGDRRKIRAVREDLRASILRLKRWKHLSESERDEIRATLAQDETELGSPVNNHKVKALQHIARKQDLKDKLGRNNPTAAINELEAAVRSIDLRSSGTVGIERAKHGDVIDLTETICSSDAQMRHVMKELLEFDKEELLNTPKDSPARSVPNEQLNRSVRRIELLKEYIQPLTVQPFRKCRDDLDQLFDEALLLLKENISGDHEPKALQSYIDLLRQVVVTAWFHCKHFDARHRHEQILWLIKAAPRKPKPERLRALVEPELEFLNDFQVQPDCIVPELVQPFQKLVDHMEKLRTNLTTLLKQEDPVTREALIACVPDFPETAEGAVEQGSIKQLP